MTTWGRCTKLSLWLFNDQDLWVLNCHVQLLLLINQAAIYNSELNVRGGVWKHSLWTWKICLPSFNETLSRQWGHIKRNALGCLHSFRLKQTLAELMGVHRHLIRRTLWRRLEVHIVESSLFLRTAFPHKGTHLLYSASCRTNKSNLWPSRCAGRAFAFIYSQ